MSFEKLIRIPTERIGVLIGKSGKIKSENTPPRKLKKF
jgi:rRNA processing protein Krr1/Pno1